MFLACAIGWGQPEAVQNHYCHPAKSHFRPELIYRYIDRYIYVIEDSHLLLALLAQIFVDFAGFKLPLTLAWMICFITMFIFLLSEQLSCRHKKWSFNYV